MNDNEFGFVIALSCVNGTKKIFLLFNNLPMFSALLLNPSLVDIPRTIEVYLGENYNTYLKLAEEKETQGKILDLMPKEAFIHPISVKSFLKYTRDNKDIDFARFGRDNKLETLNNIDKPLFMRWGNDKEMILQKADELVSILNNIIVNEKKDINYVDGANHGYNGKEEILAKEIMEFINKI